MQLHYSSISKQNPSDRSFQLFNAGDRELAIIITRKQNEHAFLNGRNSEPILIDRIFFFL